MGWVVLILKSRTRKKTHPPHHHPTPTWAQRQTLMGVIQACMRVHTHTHTHTHTHSDMPGPSLHPEMLYAGHTHKCTDTPATDTADKQAG